MAGYTVKSKETPSFSTECMLEMGAGALPTLQGLKNEWGRQGGSCMWTFYTQIGLYLEQL